MTNQRIVSLAAVLVANLFAGLAAVSPWFRIGHDTYPLLTANAMTVGLMLGFGAAGALFAIATALTGRRQLGVTAVVALAGALGLAVVAVAATDATPLVGFPLYAAALIAMIGGVCLPFVTAPAPVPAPRLSAAMTLPFIRCADVLAAARALDTEVHVPVH
jgi:hypothetical protein